MLFPAIGACVYRVICIIVGVGRLLLLILLLLLEVHWHELHRHLHESLGNISVLQHHLLLLVSYHLLVIDLLIILALVIAGRSHTVRHEKLIGCTVLLLKS